MSDPSITRFTTRLDNARLSQAFGQVREVTGLLIRATLPDTFVGEICEIHASHGNEKVQAEVVGFREGDSLLMPLGDLKSLGPNSEVIASGSYLQAPVGVSLLGRVLNGLGEPIDGLGPLRAESYEQVYRDSPHPLTRERIRNILPVGVRAIDGVIPIGQGQRMGIFAPAGGGKSTLLGMIARNTDADVKVIVLVGERGREVKEFLEDSLRAEGMRSSVVIVATAEQPAVVRMKAAYIGTTIAEYFRDQLEKKVILMMDSVTRFARAQREVGLARGEPPARYGFPPSVFAELPRLFERAGNAESGNGSITGFYTVLVEGDNLDEPVADETRSLLDGHIVLSRKLAYTGHRPSIDILASESRVKGSLDIPPEARAHSERLVSLLGLYRDNEDAIKFKLYGGDDPSINEAIERKPAIDQFLRQGMAEASSLPDTYDRLEQALTG